MMDRETIESYMPKPVVFIGLDFGKTRDHSAWTVIERLYKPHGEPYNVDRSVLSPNMRDRVLGIRHETSHARVDLDYEYHVLDTHRLPLGIGYDEQAKLAADYATRVIRELDTHVIIVPDKTGAGDSVVDNLIRELNLTSVAGRITPCPVFIKASGPYTRNTHMGYNVAISDIVHNAAILLQRGLVQFAADIPEINTTISELQNFKIKKNRTTGNDVYEAWHEGDHDDLVFALALPLWASEALVPAKGYVDMRAHVIPDAPMFVAGS